MLHEIQPRDDALHLGQRFDGLVDSSRQLVDHSGQIGTIAARRWQRFLELFVPETLPVLDDVE